MNSRSPIILFAAALSAVFISACVAQWDSNPNQANYKTNTFSRKLPGGGVFTTNVAIFIDEETGLRVWGGNGPTNGVSQTQGDARWILQAGGSGTSNLFVYPTIDVAGTAFAIQFTNSITHSNKTLSFGTATIPDGSISYRALSWGGAMFLADSFYGSASFCAWPNNFQFLTDVNLFGYSITNGTFSGVHIGTGNFSTATVSNLYGTTLIITNGVTIGGNLTVVSNANFESVTITNNVTIGGTLNVSNATFNTVTVSNLTGNLAGMTNLPLSGLSTNGMDFSAFTNKWGARIPWFTNAGIVYYLQASTNAP